MTVARNFSFTTLDLAVDYFFLYLAFLECRANQEYLPFPLTRMGFLQQSAFPFFGALALRFPFLTLLQHQPSWLPVPSSLFLVSQLCHPPSSRMGKSSFLFFLSSSCFLVWLLFSWLNSIGSFSEWSLSGRLSKCYICKFALIELF